MYKHFVCIFKVYIILFSIKQVFRLTISFFKMPTTIHKITLLTTNSFKLYLNHSIHLLGSIERLWHHYKMCVWERKKHVYNFKDMFKQWFVFHNQCWDNPCVDFIGLPLPNSQHLEPIWIEKHTNVYSSLEVRKYQGYVTLCDLWHISFLHYYVHFSSLCIIYNYAILDWPSAYPLILHKQLILLV